MQTDFSEGAILLINKPYRWTSFDAVKKVRNTIRIKKVGHAGTLDPLATGLLIICTGKFTKKINDFQNLDKEYTGELILGKTTPSVDLETEVDQTFDISHISEELIHKAAQSFLGNIQQVPPIYSAVKIDGERAYKHARKGTEVEMKAREVCIEKFEITEVNLPSVKFCISCSKGTYIRSLVRDLGEKLNSGAYLAALTRTRIGDFHLSEALNLEDFVKQLSNKPE